MDLSREFFNLVVHGAWAAPIFDKASGHASFPADRLFEYTGDSVRDRFSDDLALISKLPTLLVAEVGQRAKTQTPACVTSISNVTKHSGSVHFDFRHLANRLFTSEEILLSGLFEAHVPGENTRTHWAVKRGDVFERILNLLNHQQPPNGRPSVFDIEPWPLPQLEHVAVMMPFAQTFEAVYDAIRQSCRPRQTQRVDEIFGPSKIANDIFAMIEQSRLVVCDLTGKNPNVLYEVGLAHARNRDVVIITQQDDDVPFDLRHIRYIKYLNNEQGLQELAVTLSTTVSEYFHSRARD